jgi:uncharacterized membrane protein (DUF4010 family)
MSPEHPVIAIAVALAAGALIGAERQQAHGGAEIGGIRTYPLLALAGAVAGLLRPVVGDWILVAVLGGIAAILVASFLRSKEQDPGVTSEVAALVTALLGVLAATPQLLPAGERYLLVAGSASVVMALLALKKPLHGFISKVSTEDVYATVKFAVLAAVALPLLPNEDYGPLQALNPFKIGLMVVLVAGVSFAGYVTARAVGGGKGFVMTGLVGGLVSSTAVTLTFSGRAREHRALARLCAVAIIVASSVMFGRMIVLIATLDPRLLVDTGWPLGAMTLAGLAAAFVLYRRTTHEKVAEAVPLTNPFALKKALTFGAIYAVIKLVSKAAEVYAGDAGVLASAFLAGLTDVDAITLSIADLHRGGLSTGTATAALTIAAGANTLFKAGLAFSIGGRELGWRVGVAFLVAAIVGAAAMAGAILVW